MALAEWAKASQEKFSKDIDWAYNECAMSLAKNRAEYYATVARAYSAFLYEFNPYSSYGNFLAIYSSYEKLESIAAKKRYDADQAALKKRHDAIVEANKQSEIDQMRSDYYVSEEEE
jgi:hypothetical protein